ncbi:MAG: hypothetical protein ACFB0C_06540 [Leptolyngbyaceae cyanobacterium]
MMRHVFRGIAIAILWIFLGGCVQQTTEIKFVIPEDFHGEIQVFEHPLGLDASTQVPTQITLGRVIN